MYKGRGYGKVSGGKKRYGVAMKKHPRMSLRAYGKSKRK